MRAGIYDIVLRFRPLVQGLPAPIRRLCQRLVPRGEYNNKVWESQNPHRDAEEVSTYPAKVEWTVGIIKEFTRQHANYIGACIDLGVPYKVLDISGPNWIEIIQSSGCDAFLIRPSAERTIWKTMFDERVKVMVEELGKIVYPSYDSQWLYESKRRMAYWLEANGVAHPKTWVFYNHDEARDFARTAKLPIVLKSDFGSGALGVRIIRNRRALLRSIDFYFNKGYARRLGDPRDIQWGNVILQEYIADALEWRVLRLGDSYFAHQKLKKGDFHSGSDLVGWEDPPRELLDFAREITENAGFTSMDIDIFEAPDGRYLVNELQALFGSYLPYQMRVKDKPGRYLWDESTKDWRFEEGIFNQNGSCNLRVEALLRILEER